MAMQGTGMRVVHDTLANLVGGVQHLREGQRIVTHYKKIVSPFLPEGSNWSSMLGQDSANHSIEQQ